ncbi:hypothetical protein [Streptomyces sp. NBC_01022]|uniref:hypothetical protein n=1 Tax=Streptomyces sp. NBC_01022 TaxID=2903723 RepID=UPI002DD8F5F3|nr:hypothetical protein [Streptomyces sp. NBC_01022]WRZ82671.1 hypothetical protein OG316_21605 [Streptomyces sp. NBC_01022]
MISNILLQPAGEPEGYETQLATLGLEFKYFDQILRMSEQSRRDGMTKDDAKNAPGSQDYFTRVRELRYTLRTELGWHPYDPLQAPLIVNENKTVGIGVLLGDHRTGLSGFPHPRSRRPAGPTKEQAVARNQSLQLSFDEPEFVELDGSQPDADDYALMETWYLLTHRHQARETGVVTVRSELSLPDGVGHGGKVDSYQRRILLPAIKFPAVKDYAVETTGDHVVSVEER